MNQVPDTEIRSEVRALLSRHRIDLQRIQFRIASGTVRVSGELAYHGGAGATFQRMPTSALEALEHDLAVTRGVKHTYFDLSNWHRLSSGEWEPAEAMGIST
jgi:hypothetical protein